jgi:hypothetical protein
MLFVDLRWPPWFSNAALLAYRRRMRLETMAFAPLKRTKTTLSAAKRGETR